MTGTGEEGAAKNVSGTLKGSSPIWLQATTALLAAAATLLGAWSTYESRANGDALSRIEFQKQTVTEFSKDIGEARPYFSNQRAQIESMVEVSRLWTVADTVQEKLVLFEIAKVSNQRQAIDALKILATGDDQLHPRDNASGDAVAITTFERELTSVADAGSRVSVSISGNREPGSTKQSTLPGHGSVARVVATEGQPSPSIQDVPLTASSNASVASSARLIVALNQSQGAVGWVFVGDALDKDGGEHASTATFEDRTKTSSIGRPAVGNFIACSDLNLRASPWNAKTNQLGRLITIVPRGTTLNSSASTALTGIGRVSGLPIHAWWANVTVKTAADYAAVDEACADVPTSS